MNSARTLQRSQVTSFCSQLTPRNEGRQPFSRQVPSKGAQRQQRLTCFAAEQSFPDKVRSFIKIYNESKSEGMSFKQSVADAIAGDYDRDAVTAEVEELAKSAPLVLFTWESSPACKKALEYLEIAGASPTIVRLDDPWEEGNPRRAALGRLTTQSSVPSIWVNGEYIGGCSDGPSEDAPGLVPLAFQGKLKPMLEAAGALKAVETASP